MSWLFSQALVEAYSAATCSDGVPSVQLSVMPTPQPFWRNDKPMDASFPSRFGLTSQLLTADRGEDLLMWFRGDFLAKTSAQRAAVLASVGNGQGSGEKWQGSFAKWDRAMSLWKTHQFLLLGGLEPFSGIWPRWGLMRGGECWEQSMPGLPTSESGYGLLPTPRAEDSQSCGAHHGAPDSLTAYTRLYPTPTASSYGSCQGGSPGREGQPNRPSLQTMANRGMWPTPTKSDGCGGPGNSGRDGGLNLRTAVTIPTPTVCGNYNRKGLTSKSGDGLATFVRERERESNKLADSGCQHEQGEQYGIVDKEGRSEQGERPAGSCGHGFGWWAVEPDVGRVAHGVAFRVDRLKALGNGQVPGVVALEWRVLA